MKSKITITIITSALILLAAIVVIYGQVVWSKFRSAPTVTDTTEAPAEESIDVPPVVDTGPVDLSVEERQAALEQLDAESGVVEASREERAASLQALDAEAGAVDFTIE